MFKNSPKVKIVTNKSKWRHAPKTYYVKVDEAYQALGLKRWSLQLGPGQVIFVRFPQVSPGGWAGGKYE